MADKGSRSNIEMLILDALMDSDKYGYAIATAIKSSTHSNTEIKQPTLYAYLKKLESKEFISSYWGEESNGGRRRYYKLTDKGRNECIANSGNIVFEMDDDESFTPALCKEDEPVIDSVIAQPTTRKRSTVSDDELDLISQRLSELEGNTRISEKIPDQESQKDFSVGNVFQHIEFEKPQIPFVEPKEVEPFTVSKPIETDSFTKNESAELDKTTSLSENESVEDNTTSIEQPKTPEREEGIFYMEDFINENERSIDIRFQPASALKKTELVKEKTVPKEMNVGKEFIAPVLSEEEQKRINLMYGIGAPVKATVRQQNEEKSINQPIQNSIQNKQTEPDAVIINEPLSDEENRRVEFLYRATTSTPKETKKPESEIKPKERSEQDYKHVLHELLGEQIESMPKTDDSIIVSSATENSEVFAQYIDCNIMEIAKLYNEENIAVKVYNNGILNYKPKKVLYPNKLNMTASMFTTFIFFAELLLLYVIAITNVNDYNPTKLLYVGLTACCAPVIFGLILLISPNKKSYFFAKPSFTIVICCIIAAVLILFVFVVNALLLDTDFRNFNDLVNNVISICVLVLAIPVWSLIRAALYKKFIN